MVIKWPGVKRLRNEVSRLKKLLKAEGVGGGVLHLTVAETGEWFMSITHGTVHAFNSAVPDMVTFRKHRQYTATEEVYFSKPSNSEREALSLLGSVKEEYVLSQATDDDVDVEEPYVCETEGCDRTTSDTETFLCPEHAEEEAQHRALQGAAFGQDYDPNHPEAEDVLDTSEEDAEDGDIPDEPTAKLDPEYVQGFNDGAFQRKAHRMAAKTFSFANEDRSHPNLSNHPQDLDVSERETTD